MSLLELFRRTLKSAFEVLQPKSIFQRQKEPIPIDEAQATCCASRDRPRISGFGDPGGLRES